MNIKEQFLAYLKANGIEFEEIGNNILFTSNGYNLIAKDFGTIKKKNFTIGIPLTFKDAGRLSNPDKKQIKEYLEGKSKDISGFFREIVNNPDNTISPENIRAVIKDVTSKDYDDLWKKFVEMAGAAMGEFYEFGKSALSTGADILRDIADIVSPKKDDREE